jgi:hypothetical protein
MTDRAELEVESLLKIVLVLVVIWLILEIAGEVLEFTLGLLGPLLGVVVLLLIVLWLVDRI